MFIYLVTNLIDGKMYVGKTEKTVEERWRTHLNNARAKQHQEYLYRAIRKHGAKAFSVQCLTEAMSSEDLSNLEKLWIMLLNTTAPTGYNLTYGGEGVAGTPETRKKQSLKAATRRLSEATKLKIGDYNRGKPKPPAQRAKMAARWDEKRRAEQAKVAVRVNKEENARAQRLRMPGLRHEVRTGDQGGLRGPQEILPALPRGLTSSDAGGAAAGVAAGARGRLEALPLRAGLLHVLLPVLEEGEPEVVVPRELHPVAERRGPSRSRAA